MFLSSVLLRGQICTLKNIWVFFKLYYITYLYKIYNQNLQLRVHFLQIITLELKKKFMSNFLCHLSLIFVHCNSFQFRLLIYMKISAYGHKYKIFPFPFSADYTVADQEASRIGSRRISVRIVNSDRWEKTRTANKVFSKFVYRF